MKKKSENTSIQNKLFKIIPLKELFISHETLKDCFENVETIAQWRGHNEVLAELEKMLVNVRELKDKVHKSKKKPTESDSAIKSDGDKIMCDEIKRFEYEIWKTYFEYESSGIMKIIAFNHCYDTLWEHDAVGLESFGDYVKENLDNFNNIDTEEQLDDFLKQDKYKWQKKY